MWKSNALGESLLLAREPPVPPPRSCSSSCSCCSSFIHSSPGRAAVSPYQLFHFHLYLLLLLTRVAGSAEPSAELSAEPTLPPPPPPPQPTRLHFSDRSDFSEDLFLLGHNRIRLGIERFLRLTESGLGADGLAESRKWTPPLLNAFFNLRQPAVFKDLG